MVQKSDYHILMGESLPCCPCTSKAWHSAWLLSCLPPSALFAAKLAPPRSSEPRRAFKTPGHALDIMVSQMLPWNHPQSLSIKPSPSALGPPSLIFPRCPGEEARAKHSALGNIRPLVLWRAGSASFWWLVIHCMTPETWGCPYKEEDEVSHTKVWMVWYFGAGNSVNLAPTTWLLPALSPIS